MKKKCLKLNVFPWLELYKKQYYTNEELFAISKNYKLNKYNCKTIQSKDFTRKDIEIQLKYLSTLPKEYIQILQLYTLFDSDEINKYLRNSNKKISNILIHKINILRKIINNSPPFTQDYKFYRFVTDDFYLENIKINDVFYNKFAEQQIILTTYQPIGYVIIMLSQNNLFQYRWGKFKIYIEKQLK